MGLTEKWDKEIDLITAHPECTNGWEKDFVFDIAILRDNKAFLSLHQSFKLHQIYNKVDERLG